MLELPVFTDSHVHLGLVDPSLLLAGGIGRVLDLGWDPAVELAAPGLIVERVGPLLAAPGGYPLTSGWAPPAATVEIADAEAAAAVISGLARAGSAAVKITLNSDAGPVWDDDLLATVVRIARDEHFLPVVAHAQGAGQAERALDAGVHGLAHTPWTETLSDELLQRMAARMAWISTLDIHGWGAQGRDFDTAMGNIERFIAFGGSVSYGTDLGNGPLPVGLNRRELEALVGAGLSIEKLIWALAWGFLGRAADSPRRQVIPVESPADITLDALLSSTVKEPA